MDIWFFFSSSEQDPKMLTPHYLEPLLEWWFNHQAYGDSDRDRVLSWLQSLPLGVVISLPEGQGHERVVRMYDPEKAVRYA